jgi:hypothetical protein
MVHVMYVMIVLARHVMEIAVALHTSPRSMIRYRLKSSLEETTYVRVHYVIHILECTRRYGMK